MPQISLYIDKNTLHKIEAAANVEHVSVSKWVGNKIKKVLNFTWPNDYFELYGSIKDETFKRHNTSFSNDTKRESL